MNINQSKYICNDLCGVRKYLNDEDGIWHTTNDALLIMEQESGAKSMTADLRVEMNKILHEIRMGEPLSHDQSLDLFGNAEFN